MQTGKRRILAVDHGDRRTGLAATDYTGTIASPLPAIHEADPQRLVARIVEVCRERETELIVVGLPLTTRGTVGPRASRTQEFISRLQAVAPCPVTTMDERFSTDEAHGLLKEAGLKAARRKLLADSVAALVILRRHLGTGPVDRG